MATITRHTISNASDIFHGDAYLEAMSAINEGRRGIIMHSPVRHSFGALAALDDSWLFASGSAVAGALTLLNSGVTGSVMVRSSARLWTGVARNVIITSSGDESLKTYVIVGLDIWGRTQQETVTGPNATIVTSVKTYSSVTSITASSTSAGNVKIGFGNILGLPYMAGAESQILPIRNNKLAAPYVMTADFTAIGTAETRYITTPTSGVITLINGVSDAANGTASSTVTLKNGKAGSTISTVIFTSTYVAGVIQASTAISALTSVRGVSSGQIIEVATDGTGDGAGKARIDIKVDPWLFTAGVATSPGTATTGDPMGTVDLGKGPDATATFGAIIFPDRSNKFQAFGVDPYNG